jgi:kanamycin kinase/aminoglycoside 3'-phosphotransferase-3
MQRIPGKMSCDPEHLEDSSLLVSALSEGMQLLWRTDTAGCPRIRTLEHLLAEAEYRVDQNLVDMDNVEPETFGEGGFESPRHLLQWLRENRIEEEPVLAHGDYCLPNIFLLDGRFSGFVDVSDSGIGEKWRDIALCYRSLRDNMNGAYGGKAYPDFDPDTLFDALGITPDWEKIRYHLLLDELF